jgi:hypothetical protein
MPALYHLSKPKALQHISAAPRHVFVRRRKRRAGPERQRTSWTQKASWACWVQGAHLLVDGSQGESLLGAVIALGAMQQQSDMSPFCCREFLLYWGIHWAGEVGPVLSELECQWCYPWLKLRDAATLGGTPSNISTCRTVILVSHAVIFLLVLL